MYLTVVVLGMQGASFLWSAHIQAEQRAQGRVVEHTLCTTLGRLAALQPPAGSPAKNPSRAYLQEEHATLAELGPDIGCTRRHP